MKEIYIIRSVSYRLLNNELSKIIKENDEVTKFSLNEVSLDDIIEDASYVGLINDRKVIIINDVKYFGGKFLYKEEQQKLVNFLSNIDNIVIIFIVDELNSKKEFTQEIIKLGANVINISDLEKNNVDNIIEYIKDKGIKMDNATINMIVENSLYKENNRVYYSLDYALGEIDKLSLIDNGKITKDIVSLYSSKLYIDESLEFTNAVVNKDIVSSFNYIDKMENKNEGVLGLIGLITKKYIQLYIVKDALKNGLNDAEIVELLKLKNPNQLYYIKKNANLYIYDELKNILNNLCTLDKKIKTGYNPVYELKSFLLNL